MRKIILFSFLAAVTLLPAQQDQVLLRQIPLPTSKRLIGPSPGVIGQLNGFTPTIALSPDKRYAALLNDGYGTQRNHAHQSIAILDLNTNQLSDFPEERLSDETHQSYFIGLAFSSDGGHLYASMGSITDPTGEKAGNTGNGIAVYSFQQGKVAWEKFLKIPPQRVAAGKKVAYGVRKTAEGTVLPYPAGLAVIAEDGKPDRLLVANNYADNVVLLDTADGKILKTFDLSAHDLIPSEFPYTVVATRDGTRAWVSLWNASQVAELDLVEGRVKAHSFGDAAGRSAGAGIASDGAVAESGRVFAVCGAGQCGPSDCAGHGRWQSRRGSGHAGAGTEIRRGLSERAGAVGRWPAFVCGGCVARRGRGV